MRLLIPLLLLCCAQDPPTFAEVQSETLTPSCGFSSCHGGGSGYLLLNGEPGDRDRLVDAQAVGAPDRILVVPGDADASYLIDKLAGADGIAGDPMPVGGALDPDRLDRLRAWIDAGALP